MASLNLIFILLSLLTIGNNCQGDLMASQEKGRQEAPNTPPKFDEQNRIVFDRSKRYTREVKSRALMREPADGVTITNICGSGPI